MGCLSLWHRLIGARQINERRESNRVRQQGIQCNLGVVLDISPTGLRVLSTSSLSGDVSVALDGGEVHVMVHGIVAWCRRIGFRKYMAGLRFPDVDSAEAELLMRIAAAHQVSTAI